MKKTKYLKWYNLVYDTKEERLLIHYKDNDTRLVLFKEELNELKELIK